jgi:hypothetical protein
MSLSTLSREELENRIRSRRFMLFVGWQPNTIGGWRNRQGFYSTLEEAREVGEQWLITARAEFGYPGDTREPWYQIGDIFSERLVEFGDLGDEYLGSWEDSSL